MRRAAQSANRRLLGLALTLVLLLGGGCASRVPSEIIYAAFGASDSVGIGAVPLKQGYVWQIRDALDRQVEDVRLLNLGIPAADARGIRDVLTLALRSGLRPDLVTLWTGTNDVIAGEDPDTFETHLEAILELLTEETEATIVVGDLPDLTMIPRFREEPNAFVTKARVDAFNAAIQRQVSRYEVLLVPMAASPVASQCVSSVDGFHPNNAGHRKIANLFLKVILPAIGLSDGV
ncbi:MAG: GDSL-type esterase/lipase family protein [Myxococcota bacterium]